MCTLRPVGTLHLPAPRAIAEHFIFSFFIERKEAIQEEVSAHDRWDVTSGHVAEITKQKNADRYHYPLLP